MHVKAIITISFGSKELSVERTLEQRGKLARPNASVRHHML